MTDRGSEKLLLSAASLMRGSAFASRSFGAALPPWKGVLPAVAVPFLIGVLTALEPLAALLGLFQWAAWAIWAVILLALAGWAILTTKWIQAARRVTLVLLLGCSFWIGHVGMFVGWTGHLAVGYPRYAREIRASADRPRDKLLLWSWGGYLIFDDIYLAYDDSDALRLPRSSEPAAFQSRLAGRITNVDWDATRLVGHFYVLDVHG